MEITPNAEAILRQIADASKAAANDAFDAEALKWAKKEAIRLFNLGLLELGSDGRVTVDFGAFERLMAAAYVQGRTGKEFRAELTRMKGAHISIVRGEERQ